MRMLKISCSVSLLVKIRSSTRVESCCYQKDDKCIGPKFKMGIIAPKAEVSTRISVKESLEPARGAKMNPATISSKNCKKRMGKGEKIIRQKGVCHTEYNMHCKCFLNSRFYEKRPPKLMESVRPPRPKKISKSATTVAFPKRKSVELFANKETSGDELPKKSEEEEEEDEEEIVGHELKGAAPEIRKLCPCCSISNEPKVQFRNFTTSSPLTLPQNDKDNRSAIGDEGKEISSKCEVCNCPVCIKYENYFIHRAVEHKRGALKSKFTQKTPSESNDSVNATPNLSPAKCFCFKDKKDYNNEMQLKKDLSQEENISSERCCICKCPLFKGIDIKKETIQENNGYSTAVCDICQCPIISKKGISSRDNIEGLRDQFYSDLDMYFGQLINNTERRHPSQNPAGFRAKVLKKPSSRSLHQLQKNKWGYKEVNQKGTGIWEIKADEWNRM